MSELLAPALLAAVAAALVMPVAATGRTALASPSTAAAGVRSRNNPAAHARGESGPARARVAGGVAGVALFVLIGGAVGVLGGLAVAVAVPVITARMEPVGVRRRRIELVRSAPVVADLLCASLRAGVPLEQAVPVVARAVGSASGEVLLDVHRRVQLGQPVESAWAGLAGTPGLGGISRAVARSHRTGSPLADVLGEAAGDLRADAVAASLEQVRAAGVRAVLPLGLCLLPAFVLLGIVPIVGGLLPSL